MHRIVSPLWCYRPSPIQTGEDIVRETSCEYLNPGEEGIGDVAGIYINQRGKAIAPLPNQRSLVALDDGERAESHALGQTQRIFADIKVLDQVYAVAFFKQKRVAPDAAPQLVAACATAEHIAPQVAVEFVVLSAAIEDVACAAAREGVFTVAAAEGVLAGHAQQVVVALVAVEIILAATAFELVVVSIADEDVVA